MVALASRGLEGKGLLLCKARSRNSSKKMTDSHKFSSGESSIFSSGVVLSLSSSKQDVFGGRRERHPSPPAHPEQQQQRHCCRHKVHRQRSLQRRESLREQQQQQLQQQQQHVFQPYQNQSLPPLVSAVVSAAMPMKREVPTFYEG